ncbi:MAG: 4-(cytidine 5'-diphospho)-2-C-methyl-D-erythritol kinase, partial [Pikeienuella sp.]
GGGSADAGAALRMLARLWPGAARGDLAALAGGLGADVPVCLASRPAMMAGAGEDLSPAPTLPRFHLALVNPNQPLSTAEVFAALERRDNPAAPQTPGGFRDALDLAAWLRGLRNDLEPPARRLRPAIGEALTALKSAGGCLLARMSGSGATCFGLFAQAAKAEAAARAIAAAEPGWWTAAAPV